jgi:HEAT repeat protein
VILLAVAHIGIVQQDDQTATKVVDALAHADSLSPVEPLTHPSLRLGLACLADDPGVRRSLAERLVAELATIMAGQPYPELVPTFVNTARALPGLRPTSATTIDALASLASHPSWEARMEATRLLSNATTKSAAARSVCERLLGDEHRDVRVHAALGLARVADLRDRDEVWVALSGYRSAAAHIEVVVREFVAQLPPDAVTRLRALATAPVNPSNHSVEIALLLAESPPAREDAVGVLTGLLGHQDPRVRIRAADALIGLACNTSQAAATLSELLAHRDSWVRLFAADTLSHLSHTLDQATTALVDLLSDPDPAVCASAAISLVSLGHIADEVTETLTNLLTSPSPELRSQAAETLRHLGQAGDQLAGLLTHPDPGVCCLAATRLIRLGRTSNQVISTLVGLLSHPDLRYEAAAALIRVGAVSDDVVMALTKPRPEGRRPAAGTVASMGHKGFRAVRAAVEVATDEPSEVLNACRRAVRRPPLLQEGDGLTLAQLVKADDGDTQARRDAKAWLFSWFWWTIEDRRGSRQA